MTKRIPLSQGQVALVDDADYDWLSQWKWSYLKTRSTAHTGYAVRCDYSAPKSKTIYMHRLILGLGTGEYTDHVNGEGLDNRRANLRKCTPRQNSRNSRKRRRTAKNPFRGVRKVGNRWQACIKLKSGTHHLGMYATSEEAAIAYNQAALEHFGKFAQPNPVTLQEARRARMAHLQAEREHRNRLICFGCQAGIRRRQLGLSQGYVSWLTGIDIALISKMERGKRKVRSGWIPHLRAALCWPSGQSAFLQILEEVTP